MKPSTVKGIPIPGLVRRLLSIGYESLLVSGFLLVTLVLPHILIGAFTHHVASPLVLWAHLFLLLLAYFVGFWCKGGQTLAMKTWRIRLINQDGKPVRPAQALLRYGLCWPSYGCAGIGFLWALVDPEGQSLHDRIAGTRLILTD